MDEQRAAFHSIATQVMTNPAAQFFASVVDHDPIYREIMLTDASDDSSRPPIGLATTTADEEWWKGR
jgi:hypothetical protein